MPRVLTQTAQSAPKTEVSALPANLDSVSVETDVPLVLGLTVCNVPPTRTRAPNVQMDTLR